MVLCVSMSSAQEWFGGVTAGAAIPTGASDNAPGLSPSFTAGLRVGYCFDDTPLALSVMIDGVHWLKSEHPTRSAVPLDEGLYVSRALHFPVMAGLSYLLRPNNSPWFLDIYAAGGAYWRNITCQRMASPGVMDDMEEHGWGVVCKVGLDVHYTSRWSFGVSYTAMGNPFATGGDPLPAGTGAIVDGTRRSQPTIEGYGQGFFNISIGYWLWK